MNCARGELINDAALVEGLKSGKVGGVALDVFTVEPLKDSPYYGVDNVILTPHLGGSTDEAQEAIGIQLAQQVSAYLKSGVVQNAVNVPSLSREEYVEVQPFVDLAERLGTFLSHATPGNLDGVEIGYAGRVAAGKTELIKNALLVGVLKDTEQVNPINASAIAQERGDSGAGRQEGVCQRRRGQRTEAGPAQRGGRCAGECDGATWGTRPRLLRPWMGLILRHR